MKYRKILLPVIVSLLVSSFFFVHAKPAAAVSFEEIISGAKSFFVGITEKKELTIESNITLVSEGDLNKNGEIDSGDTVKYSFNIANKSDKTYKTSQLNTNINTEDINSISNIKGVVSLDDSKKTIVIPNLLFNSNQFRSVSFEAKVNYFKDNNKTLSSEAELVDDTNKTVHKAAKKDTLVKKMDEERFNKLLQITK